LQLISQQANTGPVPAALTPTKSKAEKAQKGRQTYSGPIRVAVAYFLERRIDRYAIAASS